MEYCLSGGPEHPLQIPPHTGDPGQGKGDFGAIAMYKPHLCCSVMEGTGEGLLESVPSTSAGRHLDSAGADPVASQGPVSPSPSAPHCPPS